MNPFVSIVLFSKLLIYLFKIAFKKLLKTGFPCSCYEFEMIRNLQNCFKCHFIKAQHINTHTANYIGFAVRD